jgi:hypothetical protein
MIIDSIVMPALVAGIHVLAAASKAWMRGTSPRMTVHKLGAQLLGTTHWPPAAL